MKRAIQRMLRELRFDLSTGRDEDHREQLQTFFIELGKIADCPDGWDVGVRVVNLASVEDKVMALYEDDVEGLLTSLEDSMQLIVEVAQGNTLDLNEARRILKEAQDTLKDLYTATYESSIMTVEIPPGGAP